jgi:hypothetical protein
LQNSRNQLMPLGAEACGFAAIPLMRFAIIQPSKLMTRVRFPSWTAGRLGLLFRRKSSGPCARADDALPNKQRSANDPRRNGTVVPLIVPRA